MVVTDKEVLLLKTNGASVLRRVLKKENIREDGSKYNLYYSEYGWTKRSKSIQLSSFTLQENFDTNKTKRGFYYI